MKETINSALDFPTIFTLLVILVVLIFLLKLVNGDFSPVSIVEVDRQIVENKDSNNVVTKNIVITYKKTYNDGRIKMSYKKISIK